MHGLPPSFDGAFLVGRTLQLICFSANTINLHFDERTMITVEGSFCYRSAASRTDAALEHVPVSQSDIMRLLEHTVREVSAEKDGTLTLVFDNDDYLKCLNDPHHESYHIKYGDDEIHV